MARKKILTEEQIEGTQVAEVIEPQSTPSDIPENAKDLLKIFNDKPELWITPQGNVYQSGSQLALSKGAILYKNPYFNK